MKRIWMFLAMAFVIATASIPEGMAQVRSDVRETVTLKRIWSDPEGTFVNVRDVEFINGKIFAGTVGGYLRVSPDTGRTWAQMGPESGLDLDLGMVSSVTKIDSGHILVGAADWIYRSTNGGTTWIKMNYLRNNIRIASSIFRAKEGTLFVGGWGMLRSDDNGWTWKQILGGDSLRSFVSTIVQTPSGKLIAGLNNNSVPGYAGGIIVSSDGGKNWSYSNYGLPDHKDIESLAASPFRDSRRVYAAIYDRGIYVSDDEGLNWRPAPGISGIWAHAVAVLSFGTFAGFSPSANHPEQLFKENGSSWSPIGFAGKALSVLSFGVLGPNQLLVGTSDGLWLATFQILATPVEEEDGKMPTAFSLSQNYPNPFNPSTTIEFSLPKRSFVNLRIYNTIGQVVETLVSGELVSGIHSYIWNADKYPSGTYFYRLETNGFVEAKKMLLVK